jgi:hypothetical protein
MKESILQTWTKARLSKEHWLVLSNKQKYERGWPDLICFVKHKPVGFTIFIELKTGTTTSKIQDYILQKLSDMNFFVYVAKSKKDIEQIIKEIKNGK